MDRQSKGQGVDLGARKRVAATAHTTFAGVYVPILSKRAGDKPERSPDERLAEAVGLAQAIDLDIRATGIVPLSRITPATLIGTGKVEEIRAVVAAAGIELVIVDHPLSPGQQRNLERALNAKVLDRTGLILEIFGRRARTREGRLQVELAHLTYQKSRLVRSWTHLERQRAGGRGGATAMSGPGETQMELDRRLIGDRIDTIKVELKAVERTRALHRKGRDRVPYPIVALVGYTNAGKSTLFNRLTGSHVLAKDMLFATLDPTMREVRLGSGRRVILSDTVGFISELPTTLVAAFRATLEEVIGADLVLHVRDIAHPESEAQAADVEAVLAGLGVDVVALSAPIVEVWNKVDLVAPDRAVELRHAAARAEPPRALISAATGEGIDALLAMIDQRSGGRDVELRLEVAPACGKLVHWLHENAAVIHQSAGEDGTLVLSVRIEPGSRQRLERQLAAAGPGRARLIPAA